MLICSHTLLYRATSELQLVPWMHWYLEFATLKKIHLKASSKQWVAMRCYAASERCSLICLPPSQMHLQARRSARLVARPILQPGSSYHLKTMMKRHLRNRKKTAMMHLLEAIAELLPWENSKLMSVVHGKLTISNINQTVSDAAGSWCQGTIQSCQLEFRNLCQVETSQNFIVKRSNKMVHKVIWLGSLSGIIASPLHLSKVKPTWLPPLWNPCGGLESAGVTDRILLGLEDVL